MALRWDPELGTYVDDGIPSLAEQDLGAEEGDELEGPTAEVPFRFTEQALNPRAAAVSGRAQRDPRARSGFTGQAGGRGDISSGLASELGISPERAELLTTDFGAGLKAQGITTMFGSGERLRDHEFQRDMRQRAGAAREGFIAKHGRGPSTFTDFRTMGGDSRPLIADISDEEALFRSYNMLPEEIRGHFPLEDPRRVAALSRMGRVAPKEFERVSKMDPAAISEHIRDMQPSKSGNIMSKIGRSVTLGGVAALSGGALAAAIAPGVMAAGGLGAGALSGATSGLVSTGLNSLISGQFDPMQAAIGIGGGALMGGIGGYIAGAPSVANQLGTIQNPILRQAAIKAVGHAGLPGGAIAAGGSMSKMIEKIKGLAGTPGGKAVVSAARGVTSGIQEKKASEFMAEEQQQEVDRRITSRQAGEAGRGLQSGIFQRKLPDNPFYDEDEDLLSSGQAGAV